MSLIFETPVYHVPNPNSRSSSVSSNYSRGSFSNHSETSSSKGSDNVFGSDIYGNDFGAFPRTAIDEEYGAFPSITDKSSNEKKTVVISPSRKRVAEAGILQKSAMSAFLASPSSSRWSDLVRTMRVENRIQNWGFTSLHDDIDKIVDDCKNREVYEAENFDSVHLVKTYSKETEGTTSSSSRGGTPESIWSNFSSPSDESVGFGASISNHDPEEVQHYQAEDGKQTKVSYPIKLRMIQFMRDPNSPNAWAELVDSLREEKMRESSAFSEDDDVAAETNSDSDEGWANFDDVSVRNEQTVFVEHDFKSQQKCAMDAFLQQPSQDKWVELVQSIRNEKSSQSSLSCPTLLRLESKLEKLEEEASAAETESNGGGSSIEMNSSSRWRNLNHMQWAKARATNENRSGWHVVAMNNSYDDEIQYAV